MKTAKGAGKVRLRPGRVNPVFLVLLLVIVLLIEEAEHDYDHEQEQESEESRRAAPPTSRAAAFPECGSR